MTTEANKILEEYKFKKIGSFYIDKNNFIVDYDEQFGEMDQCIYIHVIDNKIVRVGSSKNKLKSRMKSTQLKNSCGHAQLSGKKFYVLASGIF